MLLEVPAEEEDLVPTVEIPLDEALSNELSTILQEIKDKKKEIGPNLNLRYMRRMLWFHASPIQLRERMGREMARKRAK